MNQSTLDTIYKTLTTLWSDLLGFGVVIAGFYALWVLFSALMKWWKL